MDMVAAIFTPSTPTSASTSTSTSKSTMASPELGMGMGSPSNQHHPIIHKLKKTLFDLASTNANFNPNDPSQFAALQTAFLHTFSSSTTTPTHPPYAAMIQESIEKLDEEGILTTEGMISKHIVNNYEGLPWAHKTYLKHHLDKLCESNDYICYADGTYNVPGKIKPKRKLTKRKITTKEDVVVGEENLAHEQVIELSDNHLLIQEDAGKGKRKRRRSFVFDEEEEEEGDKSLEMRVVVGEVNRDEDNGKEIGEVETVNEVLPLEGVEVEECKNTVLEQLHPRTSEEDHELVDVETEDEALLVKGVEAEECKSKELEELNPSPSEKDHGMVDVDFVKGVEVDGCNSKELEQLHPRTSEEDHGLVEVESINEVSLMKGVEVEECKGKELQLHPSPSEEDHGMVEVQTVNEVVLLEDVEVEGCKSNGLEQLHLSTSEEDHEMVDVDAINEVLLVKGVEVEECKSKELEQLHPRTSEEDHGMMNVETVSEVLLVKSVEVEEFKSKELEQLHLRTSEGGHGMMDVVTVNEVLLVKGIGVEESKSKGLEQFHTSSSEVIHGMVDVETVDEVLLVKGVEVEECKSKGLGELHPRISEEDHGRVEMETVKKVLLLKGVEVEKCKSKGLEQLRPSTYEEGRDMVDVGEGNKDPELGMVSSKEVENQVLEMDPDFSEVMSLEDNHGGNLAVDILYPLVVVPLATVPNFKSDVIGSTIENPVLEETEPHSSPSRLMMAPYEDNPVKCASVKQVIPSSKSERPLIVCALKYVKDEEEKRKNRVSHSKKAKFSQKKTEGLKEKPMPASCWQRDTKTKPHEAASSSHNPSLGRNTRRSPQNTTTSSQQLAQHDQQQQRESVNIHSTGENTKRRRQQPPQNGQLSFSRKYRGRRLTNHSSTTSSQNDVAIPSPVTLPKHKYLTKLEKTRIRERMTLSFEGGKLQPGLLNQLCNDYGASRSTIGRMWRNMRTEIKDGQVVDLTRKYTRSISTRAIDLEKVKQRGQFPKSKGTILFEDGSVKHFEDQMSSHPNGLENISMEDEEPLSHVYEKCGARKKHGMQIAKSGAHSPKVLPNSESFGKETTTIEKEPALTKKVENHLHMQLRSQDMNRHNVEDYTMKKSSSSFLEESGTKDSERTTNQLPAITKSNRVDSSSEPFEHPMEDNEEQNQHEGVQHPQQKNKDDKERPLELTEPTPEDEAYSSDQLLKPTSHQHSLQQNEQLKNSQQIKRGRGRPRNPNISPMKDATVPLLNLATTTPQCSDKQSKEVLKEKIAMENVSDPSSSQQKNESPKQEVRLRTRKQTATKKDAVVLSEPHLNEQEGLSNQNNQLGKAGRGRPEESKLTPQEATRSRGRPRKLSKLTGEHLVLPLNLDCEQKVELCELGNHQQSQHQNKKLTRGRDKIQKLGDNVGETLCSLCQNEQNGGCGRASDQHSGSQPRNNSRTQSSVEGETNSTQRKEFVAASHVALEALSARSQVDLKDQIIARRRSPRCFEAKKTLIDSQNHKSHDVQLHDQRKIGRLTPALVPLVSPDKVSVNLKDEVYSKPAGTEQANLPLDGKTHTPVSNNSKDPEHQEESRDHEACEKMEVQLTLPKQMTAKSVPKQVPLSSMRQLRSRVNRQSQVLEGTHTLHNLD